MGCIKRATGIMDIKLLSNSLRLRKLNVHEKIEFFQLLKDSDCRAIKGSNNQAYVLVKDRSNRNLGKIYLNNHSSRNNIKFEIEKDCPLILEDDKLIDKLVYDKNEKDIWEVKSIES